MPADLTVPALFDADVAAGHRRCCTCKLLKPFADYGRHARSPLGLSRQCRPCLNAASQRSKAKNADPAYGLDVTGDRMCNTCRVDKPLTDFPRRAGCLEGRAPICKACWSTQRAAVRRDNLPDMLAQEEARRDRNRENNNACSRRYHARRRREDPTLYANRQRARYWADPETRRARDRAWHAANPEASHTISVRRTNRRRAALAAAPTVDFTREQFDARMAYWGDRCYLCGGPWDAIEHVKPISRGGAHMLANIRPACTSCNGAKGARWHGPVWAMTLIDSRRYQISS